MRVAVSGVAGPAQLIGDETHGELLAGPDLARRRVNLRCIGKDGALEALVHDALILVVVKGGDAEEQEHAGAKNAQSHAQCQRCRGILSRESSNPDPNSWNPDS